MRWICLALLVMLPSAALAQQAPSFEDAARGHVAFYDQLLIPDCVGNDRALRRVGGSESNYAVRGDRDTRAQGIRIYRERYEATGCRAPPRAHNVQVFSGPSAPNGVVSLLPPGDTAITSGVMRDVMIQIFPMLMGARHPGCTASTGNGRPIIVVTGTRIVEGTPYTANASWTEQWDWEACGVRDSTPITFTFDGEGVRMVASTTMAGAASNP